MRLWYRLRQGLMRLGSWCLRLDRELAREVLPVVTYGLFVQMPRGDQAHALCVLRALRRSQGACSPELEQAALLHDVGKAGGRLTLAHRALVVLLGWRGAGVLERLAREDPRSWGHPFYVQVRHAELGAVRCAEAGCSPLTVALVCYHEAASMDAPAMPGLGEALLALKHADDRC